MKGPQIVPTVALIVSATFIGGTPGASAASETTLTIATGQISTLNPFLAFFDSDDLWLPHHLERCVTALEAHPEIDWVFGACTQVDRANGAVIDRTQVRPEAFIRESDSRIPLIEQREGIVQDERGAAHGCAAGADQGERVFGAEAQRLQPRALERLRSRQHGALDLSLSFPDQR